MKFKMFDRIFDIRNMDYGNSRISPHTNEERESISIYFDIVGDSTNNIIQENLSDHKTGNIFSLNENEVETKEYKLVNTSYTYNTNPFDSKTVYNYRFDLEEVENLEIESLILGEIEVFPYDYKEEYIEESDALMITAKIEVSEEKIQELDNLYEGNLYFDVVRNGISDKKLEMRFGQGNWSKNEGKIKQELILVEKKYDEKSTPMRLPHEPIISNMRKMLAQTKNQHDELMKLLLSKDIISEDEINTIKKESEKNFRKTMHNFYEVKDLDEN